MMEMLPQTSDRLLALGMHQNPRQVDFVLIVGRLDRPKLFFPLTFVFVFEIRSPADPSPAEIKVLDLVRCQAGESCYTVIPGVALCLRPGQTRHTFMVCPSFAIAIPSSIQPNPVMLPSNDRARATSWCAPAYNPRP